jgi:hypothetical protein
MADKNGGVDVLIWISSKGLCAEHRHPPSDGRHGYWVAHIEPGAHVHLIRLYLEHLSAIGEQVWHAQLCTCFLKSLLAHIAQRNDFGVITPQADEDALRP